MNRRSGGTRALAGRALVRCLAVVAWSLLLACSSAGPPIQETREIRQDPAVLPPLTGYPLTSSPDLAGRVEALFETLRAGAELAGLDARARALLAEAPDFHPAAVLVAEIEYLEGQDGAVLERLEAIVDELPTYVAAQILRGLAAERSGEIVTAFEAFGRAAGAEVEARDGAFAELASQRASGLRERAAEIVFHRLEDALGRGQLEIAEVHRRWLEEWIGDERLLLEAARRILAEEGDLEGELEAVCRLAELEPSPELRGRCAELEVEVGDVRTGLGLLEALVSEFPEDPVFDEQLARAKFRWRLQLLPSRVRDLARKGELTRADLATLLYWLVPQVRASQVTDPPIATDILNHPVRDEILQVADLGLMQVDEVVHRFDPDRPATRLTVFSALLRLLASTGRPFACLGGADPGSLPADRSWICEAAARCELIPEAADCLPRAAISGGEALDAFRHGLDLMGSGLPEDGQSTGP